MDLDWSRETQAHLRSVEELYNEASGNEPPRTAAGATAWASLANVCALGHRPADDTSLETALAIVEFLARRSSGSAYLFASRFVANRAGALLFEGRMRGVPLDVAETNCAAVARTTLDNGLLRFRVTLPSELRPAVMIGVASSDSRPRVHTSYVLARGTEAIDDRRVHLLGLDELKFVEHDFTVEAVSTHRHSLPPGRYRRWRMERRLVYAATMLALGSSAYEYAVDYATRRRAFGKHICEHQAVALHIADMAGALEMARLLTLDVAAAFAAGRAHASAQATWCIARDTAKNVAVHAVQMLGGHGLLTAHPVERLLRDICTVAALGAESP